MIHFRHTKTFCLIECELVCVLVCVLIYVFSEYNFISTAASGNWYLVRNNKVAMIVLPRLRSKESIIIFYITKLFQFNTIKHPKQVLNFGYY